MFTHHLVRQVKEVAKLIGKLTVLMMMIIE
jgi:hypothetical protein